MKYLEPVHLARLRSLRLSFRRMPSSGPQAGAHRTRTRGRSQDFSEHREYVPGDELKLLDWKVYARKDRYFVRQYEEERNLRAYVLIDGSGSMSFRGATGRLSKWDYACHCAAAVAYLVLSRADAAGLLTFSDRELAHLAPRARLQTLPLIDAALAKHKPDGRTRLPDVLKRFAPGIGRRSLLVVVSDLFGPPEPTIEVLKALRSQNHDVLVLRILDPVERDLDLGGPVLFKDLETPEQLRLDVDELRSAYRKEFEHLQRLYQSSLRASGIGLETLYTDVPWDDALPRALSRAGKLL